MQDPKKSPKIAIWAPSHNFVGLYLRNYSTYRQSEKNLLSSNVSSTVLPAPSPYLNMTEKTKTKTKSVYTVLLMISCLCFFYFR